MHEILQIDLGNSSWKSDKHQSLTVGIWSPYMYPDLEEVGRMFFIIVSERASFSERILQGDPLTVKVDVVQHLRNNHPHSYIIKEKLRGEAERNEGEKEYIGDFRTMKPFLQTFRELTQKELEQFVSEFVQLTDCKYQSEQADFLVNVLDGNSELHYELASKLSEIHKKAEDADKRIQELIHNLRQETLHDMAIDLLKRVDSSNVDWDEDKEYNDPTDFTDSAADDGISYRKNFDRDEENNAIDEFYEQYDETDDYTEPLRYEND